MSELFRSVNLVVRRVPAKDLDRWVVTFDHYSIGQGFDREGFGEAYLKSQGISAIHVLGRGRDWYQYADLDAALAAVKFALAGATRVMTYGSSMGAYAAVRFADAVGAHAVLALSPQYSIDPARAPFETRWPQESQRIGFLPQLNGPIRSRARQIIAYDPRSQDRVHVGLIADDIAVEHLHTPFSGHPAGALLSDIGALGPLVSAVLADTVNIGDLQRAIRSKRGESAVYHAHLAAAQPACRRRLAIEIARRAVAIKPDGVYGLEQLAKLLSLEGEHDEALSLQRRALAAKGSNYSSLLNYAELLKAAGRPAEALEIAREVLAVPGLAELAHLHAWHGMMAWTAGELDEAAHAAATAVRLHPENTEYSLLLKAYVQQQAEAQQPAKAEKKKLQPVILKRARNWLNARLSRHA